MLDWDDLRFFLAIVRQGSLSGASKHLHVAQSTVGRRLASLEGSLGVRLLNRTPEGYLPTPAGDDVRKQAELVEREALALERQVVGRDLRMAGPVRLSDPQNRWARCLLRGRTDAAPTAADRMKCWRRSNAIWVKVTGYEVVARAGARP